MRTTFAEEVAAARPRVTAVVRRLVGDDADDVVQEAVLRAFLSLSSLRDPERFESWLCGIALNVAKMRLRRAAIETRVLAAAAERRDGATDGDMLDAVRDALDVLPVGQRNVVLLHYIDGLSCEEIAATLGTSAGAVRVRLHRARAQLRRELAPVVPIPKEEPMIELVLEDVIVRVPEDHDMMRPAYTAMQQVIVILKERDGERRLPIWIGLPEATMLAYQLYGSQAPRPMTPDLMAELLRVTGADVTSVAISELRDNVFYAAITVNGSEVDARPSDAINLAVRLGTPIVVAAAVLDAAGRTGEVEPEEHAERAGVELGPGRWIPLSWEVLGGLERFRPKE